MKSLGEQTSVRGTPCNAIEVYVFCGLGDYPTGLSAIDFTQINRTPQLQSKTTASFYATFHSKPSAALKTVTKIISIVPDTLIGKSDLQSSDIL